MKTKADTDQLFALHVKEQTIHVAENTTPEQRLQWVNDMLMLLWESGQLQPKPYDIPPGFREEVARVAEHRKAYGEEDQT